MQEENQIKSSSDNLNEFAQKIKERLLYFKESKKIVSLYSNCEQTNKFSVGFIKAVSNDFVAIAHITPCGMYDGFMQKT